jgi:transcriptional regulator of aromatic amino acid metabolism
LNVFPVHVPPLRERVNDIPVLVDYFAARLASRTGKKITQIEKRSLSAMQQYSWPGNIRELQNVIDYPSSEQQGFYWWELDISHYIVIFLSYLGLVWDLGRPPPRDQTNDVRDQIAKAHIINWPSKSSLGKSAARSGFDIADRLQRQSSF